MKIPISSIKTMILARMIAIAGILIPLISIATETCGVGGWNLRFADFNDVGVQSGTVMLLVSPQGDTLYNEIDGKGLFQLSVGDRAQIIENDGLDWDFTSCKSTQSIVNDLQVRQPIHVVTSYTPNGSEIDIAVEIIVNATTKFSKGIWLEIPCAAEEDLIFHNTAGEFKERFTGTDQRPMKIPYQSSITLTNASSNIRVILRDPMIPVPVRTSNTLRLELLCADPACTTKPDGLGSICSVLEPGDTLRASFSLRSEKVNDPSSGLLVVSPHPYGAEQSTYFAFDDIPTYELGWAAPTTPENPNTPYISNYLKLLTRFPDVKFTWLLLTDNIQQAAVSNFKGWWPPRYGVSPSTESSHHGDFAASFIQTSSSPTAATITQGFPVEPDSGYIFSGMYKVESIEPPCALTVFLGNWPFGTPLRASALNTSREGWLPFEVSFRAGTSGTAYCMLKLEHGEGVVYFDDISCKKVNSNVELIKNGGFENHKPFPYYATADSSWASGSGGFHLPEAFSNEALDWLIQLQNESPEWEYSRQIGIGLHGLHHTPNSNFVSEGDNTHEFNFFDPTGDSIRMARIVEDVREIGLEPSKALAFFRFPGHRHTESVLHPVYKAGVRIIDAGEDITNYHFGRILREHKLLWQTNSVAWHDVYLQEHHDNLKATLNKGMFALMGTHFHLFAWYGLNGAWERAVDLLNWMESDYRHLIWLKGDQLSNLWDELERMDDIRQTSFGDQLTLEWKGATTLGETVYFELHPNMKTEAAIADNTPCEYEIRGNRVFITLPRLQLGTHRLNVLLTRESIQNNSGAGWNMSPGRSENVFLSRMSSRASKLSYVLFDAQGRRLGSNVSVSLSAGHQKIDLHVPSVPSGVYFVVLSEDGITNTIRLPKIR